MMGIIAGRNPESTFPVATAHNIYTYNTIKPRNWKRNGAQAPKHIAQVSHNRHLKPVGGPRVPSQSVHIPEDLYEYVITSKDDDQSTSSRVSELVEKGKEMETNGDML